MVIYTLEQPGDAFAREALLDQVFGPARFRKSSERIRAGRRPADGLALVARDGDRLVGTVRLWHAEAGVSGTPVLLLGPLAVAPDRQGEGIGAALMRLALHRAGALGHGAVLLVGDEPYYRRFGFVTAGMADLAMPGPFERARFLGHELVAGHLAGAVGVLRPTGAAADAAAVVAAA
jgi:predicted N-acetyltransferase YhbS